MVYTDGSAVSGSLSSCSCLLSSWLSVLVPLLSVLLAYFHSLIFFIHFSSFITQRVLLLDCLFLFFISWNTISNGQGNANCQSFHHHHYPGPLSNYCWKIHPVSPYPAPFHVKNAHKYYDISIIQIKRELMKLKR